MNTFKVTVLLIAVISLLLLVHQDWPLLGNWNSTDINVKIEIENRNYFNKITFAKQAKNETLTHNHMGQDEQLDKHQSSELTKNDLITLSKTRAILSRIRKNCKNRGLPLVWDFHDYFSIPRLLIAKQDRKILYGSNPKTGSTSLKKFLFFLDGDYLHKDFHSLPLGHYQRVKYKAFFKDETDLENYVKITTIRNPIIRLISAFRNKQLERHNNEYFVPNETMTDTEQFVYLVRNRISQEIEDDVHLMPQWDQIDICQFPYDIIVQFEESNRYYDLFRKLTKTTNVEFPGSRVEIGKSDHDSMHYVDQLFGSLSDEEKDIVYRRYFMDFEILGYTLYGDPLFPYLQYNNRI